MIVNSVSINQPHIIQFTSPKKNNNLSNSYNTNTVSLEKNFKPYNINFLGLSPKVLNAKAYLNSVRPANGFDKYATDVYKLDLNKLDGIQDGIKVFENMSFKEIAFIARTMGSVNTMRGCYNKCSHCYANALHPIEEDGEHINKMSWEDFKSFTGGFKELHDRLGFHLSAQNLTNNFGQKRYLTTFHDSDSIDIVLKDKTGKEHDLIDIMDELFEATGITPLFDTTGWTVQNTKLQKRAEKYAEYYSNPNNTDKVFLFNISLNPFHALHTRSVIERRAGNIEKAERFRDIYVDRVANAIYTFTPLLNANKLNFVARSFSKDGIGAEGNGFKLEDLKKLSCDILEKVKQKYIEDLKTEQRYVNSYSQINSNIKELKNLINQQLSPHVNLYSESRGFETFGGNNKYFKNALMGVKSDNKMIKSFKSANDYVKLNKNSEYVGIVDSNGKFYITSYITTYPTELQLNFANKNKKTAPIKPYLQEDLIIKKSVINNV